MGSREWEEKIASSHSLLPIPHSRLFSVGVKGEKAPDYDADYNSVCACYLAIRGKSAGTYRISENQKSRSGRRLSWNQSRRSIPLARGQQLRGDRQMGRGA